MKTATTTLMTAPWCARRSMRANTRHPNQRKQEMKTPTIAEVLHEAADVYLPANWEGDSLWGHFSCNAIQRALEVMVPDIDENSDLYDRIRTGLSRLGLKTHSDKEFGEFNRFERQEVRYAWLKFAAMLAEEQGV